MSKISVPGPKTRAEVSAFLHKLADQIAGGEQLAIGTSQVTIPDRLASKIKHKRKHGVGKVKISLYWPEDEDTVVGAADLAAKNNVLIDDYVVPDAPPADFKALKKTMQLTLHYFRRRISDGRVPTTDEAKRYAALQADFAKRAKPAWAAGVAEAEEATNALIVACGQADVLAAGRAVERLLDLKKIYHDRFK